MEKGYVEPDFNMSLSTLERINKLIIEYNSYDDSFFEQRFEVLKKLYEEVYPFENDKRKDSIKEYDDLLEKIDTQINIYKVRVQNSVRFNVPLIYNSSLKKDIFDLSKKIRVALYEHHLLMRKGEEAGRSIR